MYEKITKEDLEFLIQNEDKIPESLLPQYLYRRGFYDFQFFQDFFFSHLQTINGKKVKPAKFHKQMDNDLMSDKNLLWIMFRMSGKTTKALIYIIWTIVYKQRYFITFYAFDKQKATAKIFGLVRELVENLKLRAVYGDIFPQKKLTKDQLQKKSIAEFITTNGIKVKALGMGESPRGELHITEEGAFRPDLLLLDDIDVEKSVSNPKIIDKNYHFLKSEVFGGLGFQSRIIFLGNIIKQDGLVPRFEKEFKNNPNRIVRRQPLIEDGKIVWEAFTWEKIEELRKEQGEIAFNQNYLLIPYVDGQIIIGREYIQYYDVLPPKLEYYIGIDPAISEKETSDDFAIVISGYDRKSKNYYVVEAIALRGKQKEPFKATQTIKNLYQKYKPRYVIVESVAFQRVMGKLLKNEGIAVKDIKATKDKITRLKEKQYLFEQQRVFFSKNTEELVNQLVNFPNVPHDDLVDAMVYSLEDQRRSYDVLLSG